jgi:hypothetical protein
MPAAALLAALICTTAVHSPERGHEMALDLFARAGVGVGSVVVANEIVKVPAQKRRLGSAVEVLRSAQGMGDRRSQSD